MLSRCYARAQVNIGMQFVKAGRYGEAIRFLEAVLRQYRLEPLDEFCAGQIAIKEVLRLSDSYDAQLSICAQVRTCCSTSCSVTAVRTSVRCKRLQLAAGPELSAVHISKPS